MLLQTDIVGTYVLGCHLTEKLSFNKIWSKLLHSFISDKLKQRNCQSWSTNYEIDESKQAYILLTIIYFTRDQRQIYVNVKNSKGKSNCLLALDKNQIFCQSIRFTKSSSISIFKFIKFCLNRQYLSFQFHQLHT